MRLRLCLQVLKIDIAVVIAFDDDDLHAGHRGRGRVGAVRRLRDQADVAVALTTRFVIARDGQEPGELAL